MVTEPSFVVVIIPLPRQVQKVTGKSKINFHYTSNNDYWNSLQHKLHGYNQSINSHCCSSNEQENKA